jgi:DNA-binding transcriptional LysR family regulator
MIDVQRARALHAVATHGSVTAAAAALHVTSSALSQQLAKLEREIGQPLLRHRGRGVVLTDAGHLLTEAILSLITRAETELDARRGAVTGRMAIAAFATADRALLPAALRALRDQYPQLRVASQESEPEQALIQLDRGEIDLAVIDEWSAAARAVPGWLRRQRLFVDVADLALPAGHPLARDRGAIDLAACAGQPWITWPPGQFSHDWLVHTLRSLGAEPAIAHTAGELETILALVAAGLGVALMPRLGRGPVPEGVAIRTLRPTVTRTVYAAWPADTTGRPAVQAAIAALRECTPPAIASDE